MSHPGKRRRAAALQAFGRRWLAVLVVLMGIASAHGGELTAAAAAEPVNVVLVHGIFNRGRVFDPMVRELERAGCRCFAPSLRPNNGRTGVHDLTAKLSAQIDARFGPRARFFLVGFSMGGLVARDYVENTPGRTRVRGVFLIATPSRGTLLASLAPPGGHLRELAPGSAFLTALNADGRAWRTVPVHAYWTPLDLMIVPSVNTRWPEGAGETTRVVCWLHPWMVRNRVVIADILRRIAPRAVPAGQAWRAGRRRRTPTSRPRPPSIIAHVDGSGAAAMLSEESASPRPSPRKVL